VESAGRDPGQAADPESRPRNAYSRYDFVGLAVGFALAVVAGFITQDWVPSLIIGGLLGSLAGRVLGRRAGVPDRSPYKRWRHGI
jgi:hypothetical protein